MKVYIAAMECEARCAIANLDGVREETVCGRRITRGTMVNGQDARSTDAAVVLSGVGKSNAAAAAQLALCLFPGARLVNYGLAGGLEPTMKVGDIYRISRAVQYDFDLVKVNGTPMGTLNERKDPYIPVGEGVEGGKTLGTGDRFNDSEDDMRLLVSLGAGLRDMEGAAIAHVCETAGAELAMFKCVSDVYGSGSMPEQYAANMARCLAILEKEVPFF